MRRLCIFVRAKEGPFPLEVIEVEEVVRPVGHLVRRRWSRSDGKLLAVDVDFSWGKSSFRRTLYIAYFPKQCYK